MRTFTRTELLKIAAAHNASVEILDEPETLNDALVFAYLHLGDGTEIAFTEKHVENRKRTVYGGSVYTGTRRDADKHAELFAKLDSIGDEENANWLTVSRARELEGKKVRLAWSDVNRGEDVVLIGDMYRVASRQIGQESRWELRTRKVEENGVVLDHQAREYYYVGTGEVLVETWAYRVVKGRAERVKRLTQDNVGLFEMPAGVYGDVEVRISEWASWFYEWQGIFRRGSGAERLRVIEVLE